MGTERQGITKNVVMQRIDSHGQAVEVKYTGDEVTPAPRSSTPGRARKLAPQLPAAVTHDPSNRASGSDPSATASVNKLCVFQVLEYETVDETPTHDCRVTMYDDVNFGHGSGHGWDSTIPAGRYPIGELEKKGWKNDEMSSIKV